MPSTLGFRYAKPQIWSHGNGLSRQSGASTTTVSSFVVPNGNQYGVPIAPARYSEVRKVIVWGSISTFGNPVLNTAVVRTRAWMRPSGSGSKTPQVGTLAQGGNSAWSTLFGTVGFAAGSVFDAVGNQLNAVDFASATDSTQNSGLFGVEFDRFNAQDQDFFAAWDSAVSTDQYVNIIPALQIMSGALSGTTVFCSFGVTVVQAPSATNRTSTIVAMSPALRTGTTFNLTTGFPASDAIYAWEWIYNAAEWDNIVSVNVLAHVTQAITAGGVTLRFASTRPAFSSLLEQSYTISTTADSLIRSNDLTSLLVDGTHYAISFRRDGSSGSRNAMCFLEIVQESGFTKTNCYHDVGGTQPAVEPGRFANNNAYGDRAVALFDPDWYANVDASFINHRRFYGGLDHNATANDPVASVYFDAVLDASHDGLSSGTLVRSAAEISATPTIDLGIKRRDSDLGLPDPIDLTGERKLVWGKQGSNVWTTVTEDSPGSCGFYYNLTVPDREVPELGPIFPIDAFSPEGCAATAAGGGIPGVLVISNGATLPKKFDPVAGTIENAGICPPFSGEVPSAIVDDSPLSPEGGLSIGTYRYRYTLRNCCTGKESDPNPEDIVVDTSGASPSAHVTLNFSGIRIPGDPQICEICVYRTVVNGDFPVMAKVGCFDPDDTSTFLDTLGDDQLDFTNDSLSIANGHMPCVPIVVEFKNRIFGMGDIPQLSPPGTVAVVNGSDIVEGDFAVEWDCCLIGKFIQVDGDCMTYEIAEVLPPEVGISPPVQRLRLVNPYEGTTRQGQLFTICGNPNALYFSEPLEPEYWPAINRIEVEPGDGDRLMGGASNFDRLVICKRRKTYVMTFSDTPLEVNVPARVSSDIGCIGPRTFAQIESGTVWLSERGLAIFDGRGVAHVNESAMVNDIFVDPANPRYVRRDFLGRCIDAVGVFYPKREQYLLLLPTVQTDRGCNLMLVWDTKLGNITLLEFCQQFQSMVVAKDSEGNEVVYLGDTNGFVWVFDVGLTDGVGTPNATGTVRGTITDTAVDTLSGASYIEDSSASFIEGGLPLFPGLSASTNEGLGLAGVCVYWRASPDDEWQQATVWASTPTRLYVTPSFTTLPTIGSEYMLGPIAFECVFKPTEFGVPDGEFRNWRHVVIHDPEDRSAILEIEILQDFSQVDVEADTVTNPDGEISRRTFDMSYPRGRQSRPIGRSIYSFLGFRMTNFAPEEPIRLLNHIIGIEMKSSR